MTSYTGSITDAMRSRWPPAAVAVAAGLALTLIPVYAFSSWGPSALIITGVALGLTLVVGAAQSDRYTWTASTVLVGLGAFTLDFAPFNVYRYLLLSDLLLVAAGIVALRQGVRLHLPLLVMLCFLTYVISGLVSFLRASDPGAGLFTWIHHAFVMLIYVPLVTTAFAARPSHRTLAFAAIVVSGVLQAAMVNLAVAGGLQWQTGTRIMGALGNPSLWLLAVSSIGAVMLLFDDRRRLHLVAVAALAVIVPAAVFTRSRSIWVGIIVGTLLTLAMSSRRKMLGTLAGCALLGALAGGYALGLYPDAVQARISQTLAVGSAPDLVGRFEVVGRMWPHVVASPFVGVGFGESRHYLPEHLVIGNIASVHNVVLHAAVELGLFAAFAMVALPAAVLVLWVRAVGVQASYPSSKRLANWAFISFIALYIGMQFTPAMYEHVAYFLIAFLASLAVDQRSAESHTG